MRNVLPLNYFGSIGYFQQLLRPDSVIDVHEHFIKQTGRSRCEILSANGRIHLSVPVSKPHGSKTAMKDVAVSYATDWQRIHWKAIESAYASSTFFEDYGPDIQELIFSKPILLHELTISTIELVNRWLDLKLKFVCSDRFMEGSQINDLRNKELDYSTITKYYQLFSNPGDFQSGLSILDLIFSEGPMARKWLIP